VKFERNDHITYLYTLFSKDHSPKDFNFAVEALDDYINNTNSDFPSPKNEVPFYERPEIFDNEKRKHLYKYESNKARLNLKKLNNKHRESNRHLSKYSTDDMDLDLDPAKSIVIDISELDSIDHSP
jgi:hypothetical protein